jgi:hypothetical protein
MVRKKIMWEKIESCTIRESFASLDKDLQYKTKLRENVNKYWVEIYDLISLSCLIGDKNIYRPWSCRLTLNLKMGVTIDW